MINELFALLSAVSNLVAHNPSIEPVRIHTYTGLNAGIVLDYSESPTITTRFVVIETTGIRGISICDEEITEDCGVIRKDDLKLNAIAKALGCKVEPSTMNSKLNWYDCTKNKYNLK